MTCRDAKKKDINKIINIARENNLDSRFMVDKSIPNKFKKRYRSQWIKNFFKKKRGDYLFVSYQNNQILGFILIIKKKKVFIIDLIATAKKYRKKGVATSLINYTNNKLMKKSNSIIAGTQFNNSAAIGMYKKAIEIDPEYTDAYSNCSASLALLGRVDEAIEYVKKALDLDPDDPQIREFHISLLELKNK